MFLFWRMLSLILRIIKEKNKHEQLLSEKLVIGPTLNTNKFPHKRSLTKKLGTLCINPWTLNSWKNSACSVPKNEVSCRKLPRRATKSIHFQNKRTQNLETLGGIYKKYVTLLETSLLKNCGKLSSLSPKYWCSLYQKSSNWKAQILRI